ncbi:hypothetical protein MJO55_14730 [Mycolicibacterium rufum]|uniref:Serine/threonine protein kinase n=1 Tax=Mycolicibacterium rufum TaxID=318424 RepID=A0ABY3U4S2_9MYCO|nr:hypothetical protein [Mycolicibacterium rufum]KGI68489.1 hypothetical protein EU78_14765 [Mycolicibacterium rufum]ULP34597.1 hypothetical protein MJO55_14730 [Mycolicibacterium rufum]
MSSHRAVLARTALAAAVPAVALLAVAPSAASAPPSDSRGYIDSTARCAAPATAVVFGSTDGSRVAICRLADGDLEYRGVRVRDGARLITEASQSADGAFTAARDGIEYMVTSDALVISAGEKVIRDEPMLDFHRPGSTSAPSAVTSPGAGPTSSATPTTPLPPPLPAEKGAAGSS